LMPPSSPFPRIQGDRMDALMVTSDFPDVRVGRITEAMNDYRWRHTVISRRPPAQFESAYAHIVNSPFLGWKDVAKYVSESDAAIVHVHGEMYCYHSALIAREATKKPIVLNAHDLTIAREGVLYDPYEHQAFEDADALVFVTEQQRDFARLAGYAVDKPTAFISNLPSSTYFIEKSCLPHIGGVVCSGGMSKRGDDSNRRDLSAVADALKGALHIYPGQEAPDYGIPHDVEYDYPLYIHRLGRHDWGFAGHPVPNPAWGHSFPTRIGEYWSAGLPFVSLNVPLLEPFARRGMGILLSSLSELSDLPDPKSYRKAVMDQRYQYTTQREISKLDELYRGLL